MPLAMSGDIQGKQWIGTALQQSINEELSQTPGMSASSIGDGVDINDAAAVLNTAKSMNADTVMRGTCQISGDDLRIGIRLIDVATGNSRGSAKVSGALKDLFSLEDQLNSQVDGLLRGGGFMEGAGLPTATADAPPLSTQGLTGPSLSAVSDPPPTYPNSGGSYPPNYPASPGYPGFNYPLLSAQPPLNGPSSSPGQCEVWAHAWAGPAGSGAVTGTGTPPGGNPNPHPAPPRPPQASPQ